MVHLQLRNPWEIIYLELGQTVRERSLKSNVKTGPIPDSAPAEDSREDLR